ncbi:MAG: chorismate synthase [Candidatus Eremiobacteraeota bacterium]|nr:chorismate synthase [Candidatus Eremiobacteraeota bacterium]MBV8281473.1 chorismate synthase [Candidatus Eremiobacteraeota bacterium]
MRYLTAGESHGPALVGIIDGLPAGLRVDVERLAREVASRQAGYGRGARMKIESDQVQFLAGLRGGMTLGSPVALLIANSDHANVRALMDPLTGAGPPITRPRPGHADYAGALKYRHRDLRNVLERASARETAMRVALGALARQYLGVFGVTISGFVRQIGDVTARSEEEEPDKESIERSPVRCPDAEASARMIARIDAAKSEGDTLGGVFEVRVRHMPVGIGSNRQPSERLDARLAAALMSIQTAKAVEFGAVARDLVGSRSHDTFEQRDGWVVRGTNRAGGVEGGMSNGADIAIRVKVKPIATLMRPLASVDLATGAAAPAAVVRSDVCAVPAASVIGEAMVCLALAEAFSEKYGGDSVEEVVEHFEASQSGAARVFGEKKPTSPLER